MRDEIMEIKKEIEEVKEKSFALELLQDQRKANKRIFIMWIITFIALIGVSIYTVYLLNDIGTIETTQEIQDVNTIENSNIKNGD
jgi:heme/copper-type cytochrome/quinol oxidase subunit 2